MFDVYLYADADGTARYVGRGNKSRARSHLKKTHNAKLHEMLISTPVEPVLLAENVSKATSGAIERFWIAVFGREHLGTGSLFNLTPGGLGTGVDKGDDTAAKISNTLKAKWQTAEYKNAMRERTWDKQEYRDKVSKTLSGRKRPEISSKISAFTREQEYQRVGCILCRAEMGFTHITRHFNSPKCVQKRSP